MRIKTSVLLALVAIGSYAQAQTIKIKGSTALLPVEERWAQAYAKAKPGVKIVALGGGTTVGFNALADGSADCASAARPMTEAEEKRMKGTPSETRVGQDALLFVVNPMNPVRTLTVQQLRDIYTGKITNWQQLGGENLAIHPMAPDQSYGTHTLVREKVLGGHPFGPTVRTAASEHELMASVWNDRAAISFSGIAIGKDFRHLSISKEKGAPPYAATPDNLRAGRYPLMFPVYLYCSANANAATKEFQAWTGSAAGQSAVELTGLVPAHLAKH